MATALERAIERMENLKERTLDQARNKLRRSYAGRGLGLCTNRSKKPYLSVKTSERNYANEY
jgi:hypothetical protein